MMAIKNADVVLFLMDARMPELSGNKDLEKKLRDSKKDVLKVFNKSDLISKKRLRDLRREYSGAFFVSVNGKKGIEKLRIELRKISKKLRVDKLEVGIVGYPNVGKSALTNVLSRAAKTQVSSKAGTTTGLQWASSSTLKILDSPGVIPFEDDEVKLGVLGAKNPEKLKEPERVAIAIVRLFLDNDFSDFEKFYGVKIRDKEDEYEIMMEIGKAKKLLMKGGVVDEQRVFFMIIRDWQKGKLRIG